MKRETLTNEISALLSNYQQDIINRNLSRVTDQNLYSEEIFKNLLNLIFNYQLENLNLGKTLAVAIDLGDYENRIAFQITSENSFHKIKDTVAKFLKNDQHKIFFKLKILVLREFKVKDYEVKAGNFFFNGKDDIIDIPYLIRQIRTLDLETIETIHDFIRKELDPQPYYRNNSPTKNDEEYFQKFLNNDIDRTSLLGQAQPNLADCREVFSEDFYRDVFNIYSIHYFSILEDSKKLSDIFRDKTNYKKQSSSYSDVQSGKHNLPGGVNRIMELKGFRPGKLSYLSVSFVHEGSPRGIAFHLWVFLNGRWVYFPKPWQVIDLLHNLKNNSIINGLVRVLKFLRLDKTLANQDPHGIFATTYIIKRIIEKTI